MQVRERERKKRKRTKTARVQRSTYMSLYIIFFHNFWLIRFLFTNSNNISDVSLLHLA